MSAKKDEAGGKKGNGQVGKKEGQAPTSPSSGNSESPKGQDKKVESPDKKPTEPGKKTEDGGKEEGKKTDDKGSKPEDAKPPEPGAKVSGDAGNKGPEGAVTKAAVVGGGGGKGKDGRGWERWKQRLAEKLGKATASKYPAEFEQSTRLMGAVASGTKDLVTRIKSHVRSFEGPGKLMMVEEVGETALNLAGGLSANSFYTISLRAAAKAEKAVGQVERSYCSDVYEKVIGPLEEWLGKRVAGWRREAEELEKRRLEMDWAIRKAKGPKAPAASKAAEEARTKEHNDQLAVVQAILDQLPGDLEDQADTMATFIDLNVRLHNAIIETLDIALKQIAPRVSR